MTATNWSTIVARQVWRQIDPKIHAKILSADTYTRNETVFQGDAPDRPIREEARNRRDGRRRGTGASEGGHADAGVDFLFLGFLLWLHRTCRGDDGYIPKHIVEMYGE
jgi:hypothetical protein